MRKKNNPAAAPAFIALCSRELGTAVVPEYRFHRTRRWRFDYALPAYKVALEVEGGIWTGGRHIRAGGFLGDMEKYNTATQMGWAVLRTTPAQLLTRETIEMLRATITARTLPPTTCAEGGA